MYTPKINSFHIETLILLEKYDKIIDYINECELFPGQEVVVIERTPLKESDLEIKTLPQ